MEKAVIFDFGNVLGTFDHMKACIDLAQYCKSAPEDVYEFAIRGSLNVERETGKMNPSRFFEIMSERFHFDATLSCEKFSHIWGDIFSSSEEAEKVVACIAGTVPMFLLSNTEALHWRYIKQLSVIRKYFSRPEQLILSFRVGARKPDLRIFKEVLMRTGVEPKNAIYIDDVPEYVAAFSVLDGNSFVYNNKIDQTTKLQEELFRFLKK